MYMFNLSCKSNIWYFDRFLTDNSDYQKLIAGECTPRTAWGAGKRNAVTGPRGLPSVNVSNSHQLTPYRIAHVLPNLKIIVTMRNPVHRFVQATAFRLILTQYVKLIYVLIFCSF